MTQTRWWTVEPDPEGDGWIATNGKRRHRFAPGKDIEAQQCADRMNKIAPEP